MQYKIQKKTQKTWQDKTFYDLQLEGEAGTVSYWGALKDTDTSVEGEIETKPNGFKTLRSAKQKAGGNFKEAQYAEREAKKMQGIKESQERTDWTHAKRSAAELVANMNPQNYNEQQLLDKIQALAEKIYKLEQPPF